MGIARDVVWEKVSPIVNEMSGQAADKSSHVPPPPLASDLNVAPNQSSVGKQIKTVTGNNSQKTVRPMGIGAGSLEPKADPLGGTT